MRVDDLRHCVLKIVTENGQGLGTGYLISDKGHILTVCHLFDRWAVSRTEWQGSFKAVYHCVEEQGRVKWDLRLLQNTFEREMDFAICQLELEGAELPNEMLVAELAEMLPHGDYVAFGFASRGDFQEGWSGGKLRGEIRDDDGYYALQLTRDQIAPGFSGAPILKLDRSGRNNGRVIGLLRGRAKDPHDDFAYGVSLKRVKQFLQDIDSPLSTLIPTVSYSHLLLDIDTSHFIGRQSELEWLERQVIDEKQKLIGITGGPGVGKSTLAQRFAELYGDHFSEGVVGLQVPDQDARTTVLNFLDLVDVEDPSTYKPATELWNEHLADRQLLLILDNAEDPRTVDLKPEAGRSTVLITSRNRPILREMGVPRDAILDLSRVPFTEEDALDLMRSLFGDRAELVEEQQEEAKEICAMVGYLPQAVKVIASTMDRMPMSFAEFAASMREFHTRNELVGTLELRHVFRYSLEALQAKNERWVDLFLSLGACVASGFTHEIAAIVGDEPPTIAKWGLFELVGLSLVRGSPEGHMSLHPFVREFAREEATRRGILEAAEERYSQHFVKMVIQTGPDSIDIGEDEREADPVALTRLERDLDAILFSTNWLLTQRDPRLNQTFWRGLRPVFETRTFTEEAVQLVEGFVRIADETDDLELRPYFYRQLGKAYYQFGRAYDGSYFDNALEAMQTGLALERQRGDETLEAQAKALTSIGRILIHKGRFQEAIESHRECLRIAERVRSPEGLAYALSTLGLALSRSEDAQYQEEAIQHLSRALEIAEELDPHQTVICLSQFMTVLMEAEQYCEAASRGEQALSLIREHQIDSPRSKATVLSSLLRAYRNEKRLGIRNWHHLVTLLEQAIEVERQRRRPLKRRLARYLLNLIPLMFELGKKEDALPYCRQLLSLSDERNKWYEIARALKYVGESLLHSNRFREALVHLKRCLDLREAHRPDWRYRLKELETKELYDLALWNTGDRLEAIRSHWDLVKGFQVRGWHRDGFNANRALGRLAHWLYRYGREALYDQNIESIQLVDGYFQQIREENATRYVLHELARYTVEKARRIRATSQQGINSGIQYLNRGRCLYLSAMEQAESEAERLESVLERNREKYPAQTKLHELQERKIDKEKELVEKAKEGVREATELKAAFNKAEEYLERVEHAPHDVDLHCEFARHLRFKLGQLQAAKDLLQKIASMDRQGRSLLEAAQVCRCLGETDSADAYFRLALERRERFTHFLQYADFLAKDKGDVEKAADYYQRAGQLLTHSTSLIPCRMGVLYWKHGNQPEQARFFFERALTLSKEDNHPGNREEVVGNALKFFSSRGDCEQVERIIDSLESALMQKPFAMIAIAEARHQCGRASTQDMHRWYDKALTSTKEAVQEANGESKRWRKRDYAYVCWCYARYLETRESQRAGRFYRKAYKLTSGMKADFLAPYMLWEFQWGARPAAERLLEELQRLDINHPAVARGEALLDESEVT